MGSQTRRRARQVAIATGVVVGSWALSMVARLVHGAALLGRRR
jgi:hypothetical protein